jgi:hypothetical protein
VPLEIDPGDDTVDVLDSPLDELRFVGEQRHAT